ncbi:DNA/RNA-binding protein KIN17 [Strongylocentrotus purpuratus]|uniref:DNA/RNA-binding protein KIN17 n=1 Tax=Strongylocentrotus purpuratus TaxID=7668 RepID=A0A7M7PWN4_STRPU|nr:DNA/RNA-binding protein KIN17 [Strongylocentrotus purpuratus]
MPKPGGFLTPKAIANRVKSKGLQKLRWYCQMCQKQCRDENGFKCHLTSESHQRQLLLFADNEEEFLDTFSNEFFDMFMELLRRRFNTRRVHSNIVYNEYISDREHTHMNSTKWETLTEFVKWLGREGFCVVDHTEKGWFITYIDRDPETLKRQEALKKKDKLILDDEERIMKNIQEQVARGESHGSKQTEFTELQRDDEEEKVTFSFGSSAGMSAGGSKESDSKTSQDKKTNILKAAAVSASKKKDSSRKESGKRKSALEEIMEEEARKKSKLTEKKDYWLRKGIIVKITTKRLGEKYLKKKGVVKDVIDRYTGVVKLNDTGTKVKVDQVHLETVIPNIGKPICIVNGDYRGVTGTLHSLDEKNFSVTVKSDSGKLVEGQAYEDVCKYSPEDS